MASLTDDNLRVDKWLWAVRIFKTRSMAAEACRKGKILVNDTEVKPSRILKVGEIVSVKRMPVVYKYRVKGLLCRRQSAKNIVDFIEDVTPQEELIKLEQNLSVFVHREKGAGRPTKKDRRDIDNLNLFE